MGAWPLSDERLRAMYAGGRADERARRFARLWAAVFGLGLLPRRWVTLEVAGRRSGQVTRFPLGMADRNGQWYLVPMLGEQCNWVKNVRAAGGQVSLRHRRRIACRLAEMPVSERGPIIKRYLEQVPGARPHIPVDRHAPLADFEAISPRYPVFRVVPSTPVPHKRHWWRWTLASVAALVALVVAAAGIFIKLQPTLPALTLPTARASAPVGPVDGTWDVAAASAAGFRLREATLGFSNEVVGRTKAVTGTIVVSGGQVTSATFRVDLTTIKVGGKAQPQFAKSLATQAYPVATFTLTQPVTLSPAFAAGVAITQTVTGRLAMHGVSHAATFTISGRRDGSALQVAGSIPVTLSDWGIRTPAGYGFLGSLADHGVAEFLLVLHRGIPVPRLTS
jgi:polyisoprenoid-binding protein YceI